MAGLRHYVVSYQRRQQRIPRRPSYKKVCPTDLVIPTCLSPDTYCLHSTPCFSYQPSTTFKTSNKPSASPVVVWTRV